MAFLSSSTSTVVIPEMSTIRRVNPFPDDTAVLTLKLIWFEDLNEMSWNDAAND